MLNGLVKNLGQLIKDPNIKIWKVDGLSISSDPEIILNHPDLSEAEVISFSHQETDIKDTFLFSPHAPVYVHPNSEPHTYSVESLDGSKYAIQMAYCTSIY